MVGRFQFRQDPIEHFELARCTVEISTRMNGQRVSPLQRAFLHD